jgi:DEAD/DEAH box helicase domain-containing protein
MIVTTGTASGKSMCFNLPTLDVLCRDPKARALYLYPTKALAQDQARALHAFGLAKQVRPAIYDGDTRQEDRRQIRRRSNLILTNPDMLHMGVLPNHRTWADLFANLAVVVVDEAHVYRGVFGSHVANVLRRLRRIANAYGTEPRFLLASATIANPVDLAERLTGLEDIALVDRDGAPGARRQIAMWNPPVTDEALQTRRSRSPRPATSWPSSCARGRARSASSRAARASSSSRGSPRTPCASPGTTTSPRGWRHTGRATRPSSAASSSGGLTRARSSPS